jgi:hypothetical protein
MPARIPDEHAQILWNTNETGAITGVCVIDYRETELQERLAENYSDSNGADTSDWLSDKHPIANPAGVFASLAFCSGFESQSVAKECLEEFSQIEGAEWARKMCLMMKHME